MRMPERGDDQARIGVSVTVPEPFGTQLADARRATGDPYADLIPPHVTLLGPTVVDMADMPAVEEHLARVAQESAAFTLHLRGAATFRPVSPVVFVQVAQGIAECEGLEARVRRGILAQDLRFHYHPHVTVAHEVSDEALDEAFVSMADYDAAFEVTEIDLYAHGDDGVWRIRRSFPLGR
ncbi:2'-5' RNA ligase family protein [Sanguibacter sp. A247]|uniref:2'-5' RNA ligase family protein n=1 Tax=unclassified Sanguibacter TaxID=2645534 RepID=UPI003FD6F1BD